MSTQATETKQFNALDMQFKHRIKVGADGKFFNLTDTVFPSLNRAAAIADLLEIVGEKNIDALEHETLLYIGQAIRLELADAKTLLEAFGDQNERFSKGDDL